MKVLKAIELDGAVMYAFLARATNIAGSAGTVLLIVRFLSPIEQGYYYTLLSLVSLQVVFEMGFSFVVQQLAAHECIHLELLPDGSVVGDPVAQVRLASALRLSLRFYTVAAGTKGLILAPLGMIFFARHAFVGSAQIAWQGPWLMAVAASMAGLWCVPLYSFIEGCGQVRAVAAMRLRQSIASSALAWAAMLLHHGLYSPAMVIVGQIGVGLLFITAHLRLLAGLGRYPACGRAIRWSSEVWPFQWRIAVSWMCSYFTVQIFIPIVFALRGPVEAGQMGMSLSITGYMTVLALVWVSTKTTSFGSMIARKQFQELERSFRRAAGQSIVAFAGIAIFSIAAVALLPAVAPRLAQRMVSAWLFAALVLGAAAGHMSQCMATLIRCFKQEPFLVQSLLVAASTLMLAAISLPRLGNAGAALSYLFATGAVGLPLSLLIFVRTRRRCMTADSMSQPRRRTSAIALVEASARAELL